MGLYTTEQKLHRKKHKRDNLAGRNSPPLQPRTLIRAAAAEAPARRPGPRRLCDCVDLCLPVSVYVGLSLSRFVSVRVGYVSLCRFVFVCVPATVYVCQCVCVGLCQSVSVCVCLCARVGVCLPVRVCQFASVLSPSLSVGAGARCRLTPADPIIARDIPAINWAAETPSLGNKQHLHGSTRPLQLRWPIN